MPLCARRSRSSTWGNAEGPAGLEVPDRLSTLQNIPPKCRGHCHEREDSSSAESNQQVA
jgi:hypothetical protein